MAVVQFQFKRDTSICLVSSYVFGTRFDFVFTVSVKVHELATPLRIGKDYPCRKLSVYRQSNLLRRPPAVCSTVCRNAESGVADIHVPESVRQCFFVTVFFIFCGTFWCLQALMCLSLRSSHCLDGFPG